jgi:hypothetical protein
MMRFPRNRAVYVCRKDLVIPTRSCLKYVIKDPSVLTDACRPGGCSSSTVQRIIVCYPKPGQVTCQHRRGEVAKVVHQDMAKQLRHL